MEGGRRSTVAGGQSGSDGLVRPEVARLSESVGDRLGESGYFNAAFPQGQCTRCRKPSSHRDRREYWKSGGGCRTVAAPGREHPPGTPEPDKGGQDGGRGMLTQLFRFGATRHRLGKGYVVGGTKAAAVVSAMGKVAAAV